LCFDFEHELRTVLTRLKTNRRIRRICTHHVLRDIRAGRVTKLLWLNRAFRPTISIKYSLSNPL
jgi:hypothetical protein